MATNKTLFVRLTPNFLEGICTDTDPDHPFGPALHIVKGKGSDRPVHKVANSAYIQGKIREGILEEVRDFDGVARNDPEHPDNKALAAAEQSPTPLASDLTPQSIQTMIAEAVANLPKTVTPEQIQEFVEKAVAKTQGKP